MTFSTHDPDLEGLDGVRDADALCLFIGEDERPLRGVAGYVDWRLCGGLSRVLRNGFFRGERGDRLLLPARGRLPMQRIFALGLGLGAGLNAEGVAAVLSEAARVLGRAKSTRVALEVPGAGRLEDDVRAGVLLHHFAREFPGDHIAVLAEKTLARLLLVPSATAGPERWGSRS